MGETIKKPSSNRVIYLDYLRILATFAVVLIHSVYNKWETTTVYSNDWISLTIYDGLVRWAVPVFVMISGALFLDNSKQLATKSLFTKYILRIVTALFFWSVVYGIYYGWKYDAVFNLPISNALPKLASRFLAGSFHLWFLFMVIGLYIITPILRKITESKKAARYFIILSLVFTFIIPTVISAVKDPNDPYITTLISNYNKMYFHLTLGYSGYFVLGYYLVKYDISKELKRLIYVLSVLGFASTIVVTILQSRVNGIGIVTYFEYTTLNVMLESLGVFIFAKDILSKINFKETGRKVILALSKYSFGVYLVHLLVVKILEENGFHCLTLNSYFMPLIFAICVFVISLFFAFILNHIPFVKKYFV